VMQKNFIWMAVSIVHFRGSVSTEGCGAGRNL
jgi:hypothetical protein